MRWKLATLVLQTHQGTWLQRLETCCSWRRTCRAKSANVSVVSGGCLSATANVDGVSGSVAPRSVEGYWWWRGCRRRHVWEAFADTISWNDAAVACTRAADTSPAAWLCVSSAAWLCVCMTSSVYIGAWRGLWLWSESEILTYRTLVSNSRTSSLISSTRTFGLISEKDISHTDNSWKAMLISLLTLIGRSACTMIGLFI